MADYKLVKNESGDTVNIKRTADNAFIPLDPDNKDYQEYLEWLAVPNTPDPADPHFTQTWDYIKGVRNSLLAKSDWTQIPDSPLTTQQKTDWATYRQELRDIPQDYVNVEDVVWPTEPS